MEQPALWNSLPHDLRSTDISLDTFKNKLKTFLFDADTHERICEFGLFNLLGGTILPRFLFQKWYVSDAAF